jgi:hypothetical protein
MQGFRAERALLVDPGIWIGIMNFEESASPRSRNLGRKILIFFVKTCVSSIYFLFYWYSRAYFSWNWP